MAERFFVPTGFADAAVELDGGEFHHLARVLRKRAGERVTLFDGAGSEATAVIVAIEKRSARLEIEDLRTPVGSNSPVVTLAVCVPKGDRFRWLVEKTVELGVRRLIPLVTERSVVKPGPNKLEKARQWVIESAKQCGSLYLMDVAEPATWAEFFSGHDSTGSTFVAHPGGRRLVEAIRAETPQRALQFVVGPEGGLTDAELEIARRAGAAVVDLGETILRVETAATALAAYVRLANPP